MAKKNFKSIKSYKNLNKSDRAYIDWLINRWYSVDFLNVIFNLASEHHPLDLMTYIAKYSKANEASDIFIKMYSPYFDIV